MFLNMAVADAYAIPFEFIDKSEYPGPNDLKTYYQHPKYHELTPGQYTDDTQRSIANFEVILQDDYFNAAAYAESYVWTFIRDPREGYSRGYQALLQGIAEKQTWPATDYVSGGGREFLRTCRRSKNSNGSVMGAAVVGILKDIEEVKLAATIQACTTHLPHTAVHAQIVALAAHYFLYDLGPKDEIQTWVMQTLEDNAFVSQEGIVRWINYCDDSESPTKIFASNISAFVISTIKRHDTLSGILREAVDRGGDTDSAAAAAIAVASNCNEIENDLPDELYEGLENGKFGRDYLESLDNDIIEYVQEQVDVA